MLKKICPLIKKECLGHGCEFYTHLLGVDPQTGKEKDDWLCAVSWLPVLLIENAGQVKRAAASVDKVATEINKQHASILGMASPEARERLLNADLKLQIEGKGD